MVNHSRYRIEEDEEQPQKKPMPHKNCSILFHILKIKYEYSNWEPRVIQRAHTHSSTYIPRTRRVDGASLRNTLSAAVVVRQSLLKSIYQIAYPFCIRTKVLFRKMLARKQWTMNTKKYLHFI